MTGKNSMFRGLFLLIYVVTEAASKERVYYVGIIELNWDYAPSGKDVITGKAIDDEEHASVFLTSGPHRIGRVYKKAVFREYTDASYSVQSPRPSWLGLLGPILQAEVDDVILVHLKNFASRNYTMHPHGVFYEKDAEGAWYPDGTSGVLKRDENVPPGGSYTYRWEVRPEDAPTGDDANCLTWVYHSHLMAPRDISSGLIGPLLTCKKGMLKDPAPSNPEQARNDVDLDIFLFFTVLDEGHSWYLEENIQGFCSDPAGVDPEDPLFRESNLMHTINGYAFGNLPDVQLCQHRHTAWHLFGMGNEVDVHTATFHGNTLLERGHRTDSVSLFPATFVTAAMVPLATGKWLLSCQVNDHLMAGMQALYEVKSCDPGPPSLPPPAGVVRQYYLAAQNVLWDYAPSGKDLVNNRNLTEPDSASEVFFGREGGRIGGRYKKAVFRAYTDNTFTVQVPVTPASLHLGLLGPVLRAEVGDTIKVEFMNKADRHYSVQPHGLNYDKHSQGTPYQDGAETPGSQVAPGQRYTYTWQVLEGPSPWDPSCVPYLYYSASDMVQDTNAGLVGPLLVCKTGTLGETGVRADVDRELFMLFSIMDENLSWYLEDNILSYGSDQTDRASPDFEESNKMHSVNGFLYGNLAGLEMCAGERVVWYTFGLGTETDIHGVYFQGNTFQRQGATRDTLAVFPHTTATTTMEPQTAGVFEVSCQVGDHYLAGMTHLYTVRSCPWRNVPPSWMRPRPSKVVHYYISAEEVEWDYCPDRRWELEKNMAATPQDSPGDIFVGRGINRIGSRYRKAVFREYTDDSFTTRKQRRPEQEHMGILGPLIRAEVGEQIVITFMNKASRPYSMWPHGVESSDVHTPIPPGYVTEFRWDVPERSGPGPSDSPCISYAYYSNVDYIKDVYSGLLGPLVVCRPGTLQGAEETSDRWRTDVDKEFALLFLVFNENESWYLDDNIRHYLQTQPSQSLKQSSDFLESNRMHGINGLLYGNIHGLTMTQGQSVAWYLMAMGTEVDIHTVHFHAETFIYKTDHVHRADVFDLFPGTFQTLEMVARAPGTWLLHCHVNDHIHAGMEGTFTIKEYSSSDPPPS